MSELGDSSIDVHGELEASYRPDAIRPAYLDPVFEGIRLEQVELAHRVFDSVGEAQASIDAIVQRFERECVDKGFIPQSVRLSGAAIKMPRQHVDPFTGESTICSVAIDDVEGNLGLIAKQAGIDGLFMGIGYRLIKEHPDQENDGSAPLPCRASLYYQVRVTGSSHLNGYTELCATGEVLHHELEFADDRRKRERGEVRERLADVKSPQVAALIDGLEKLLATYGDYTPETLKMVANIVDTITSSDDFLSDPPKCDALEDMLMHYIDIDEQYTLTSPDTLQKTADGYTPVVMSSEEPFCHDGPLASIILAPRYVKRHGSLALNKQRRVPYLVVNHNDAVHFVPIGRLTSIYQTS